MSPPPLSLHPLLQACAAAFTSAHPHATKAPQKAARKSLGTFAVLYAIHVNARVHIPRCWPMPPCTLIPLAPHQRHHPHAKDHSSPGGTAQILSMWEKEEGGGKNRKRAAATTATRAHAHNTRTPPPANARIVSTLASPCPPPPRRMPRCSRRQQFQLSQQTPPGRPDQRASPLTLLVRSPQPKQP